jgi:hypothetical protein
MGSNFHPTANGTVGIKGLGRIIAALSQEKIPALA